MAVILLVAAAAVLAGATAAIAGFGVGSILTPVFALETDIKTAVAAVSIPHFAATSLRLWLLRTDVTRDVLLRFGLPSAAHPGDALSAGRRSVDTGARRGHARVGAQHARLRYKLSHT